MQLKVTVVFIVLHHQRFLVFENTQVNYVAVVFAFLRLVSFSLFLTMLPLSTRGTISVNAKET